MIANGASEKLVPNWNKILDFLNQDPKPQNGMPLISPNPTEDPLASYKREINDLEFEWKKQKNKSTAIEKLRSQENSFFASHIQKMNELDLRPLVESLPRGSRLDYRSIAALVLEEISKNEIARVENVSNFDPSGQIGFCFGRALLVHYLLLKAQVPQKDIARIYLVGELMLQNQMWQFHTSILVRDSTHGFLAVDPLQNQVLPLKEWVTINSAYEIKHPYSRARFYPTDSRQFLPGTKRYDPKQLELPLLKPFFDRLLTTLR